MKIAIVGGGAMGGVWAVLLSKIGHQVSVVDVSAQLVDTINADGLAIVEAPRADAAVRDQVRIQATSQPADVGVCDAVFFFVKAQHTASAAALAAPLVSQETTVVSLQNGWGNADVLARSFAPEQIVVGVTYHSATTVAFARVAHTGKGPTFVGPYKDGASLERTELISRALNEAGVENTATAQVKTEIWKKLILNAATLPTSSLTRLRSVELGQPGPLLDLVDAVTAEAVQVAQALGYEIAYEERVERIHTILAGAGAGKSSMLQDVEAQRKTEIEVVNGAVVRAAQQVGVATPLNQALVALINGLERSWQR